MCSSGIVVVTTIVAAHFLHGITSAGVGNALTKVSAGNKGTGAGFGSSSVPYSSNPLWYPRDAYTVLFDPLPFTADSITELFAAGENTLILLVVLASFPRLRYLPRLCLQRPYVFTALFYSIIFIFAFAALGNLGLITRERTLLLPFLFIVLAFPIARPGEDPYPWQRRRRRRARWVPSGTRGPVDAEEAVEATTLSRRRSRSGRRRSGPTPTSRGGRRPTGTRRAESVTRGSECHRGLSPADRPAGGPRRRRVALTPLEVGGRCQASGR